MINLNQYCPTCNTKIEVYKHTMEDNTNVYNLYCPKCSREREIKTLSFKLNKHISCPCCENEVDIPTSDDYLYDLDEIDLINLTDGFFNALDMCPICGYVYLPDDEISDDTRNIVKSNTYQAIFKTDIENGLKKWLLYGKLAELHNCLFEAGIFYTKAYDYIELKGMELDTSVIKKATACFDVACEDDSLDEEEFFIASILLIDSLRREGTNESFKHANELLKFFMDGSEEEYKNSIAWQEKIWIENKISKKQDLFQ